MVSQIDVVVLPDGRLDAKNAAAYLGLSVGTLAMQRCEGRGPAFVKRGRVFYFKDDLDEWLNAARVTSTSQCQNSRQQESTRNSTDQVRGLEK